MIISQVGKFRRLAESWGMQTPEKITFGEMREMGVRDLLIYCADYKCSRSIAVNADQWPDDVWLSDIEDRFVCKECGKRGADVRPDFLMARMAPARFRASAGLVALRYNNLNPLRDACRRPRHLLSNDRPSHRR